MGSANGKPKVFTGRILALSVSAEKGVPKSNVERVELVKDWGIAGDAHAGDWHRQVSLLAMESVETMRAKGVDVNPGGFGENITTGQIPVPQLEVGDRVALGAGGVQLEITQIGKECHTPCAIYHQVGDCVMPREGIFGRVLVGGEVKLGDPVVVTTSGMETS